MVEGLAHPQWGDMQSFQHFGSLILSGQIPYRDFTPEYPPLALILFTIPQWFGFEWYTLVWFGIVALFTVATAWLIAKTYGNAWAYLAAVLPLGFILFDRFDVVAAFLSLAAVLSAQRGKTALGWGLLSLAILTKIYPLIYVPVLLLLTPRRDYPRAFLSLAAPVLVSVAVIWQLGGLSGLPQILTYHKDRGIGLESIRGTFLLLSDTKPTVTYGAASYELK